MNKNMLSLLIVVIMIIFMAIENMKYLKQSGYKSIMSMWLVNTTSGDIKYKLQKYHDMNGDLKEKNAERVYRLLHAPVVVMLALFTVMLIGTVTSPSVAYREGNNPSFYQEGKVFEVQEQLELDNPDGSILQDVKEVDIKLKNEFEQLKATELMFSDSGKDVVAINKMDLITLNNYDTRERVLIISSLLMIALFALQGHLFKSENFYSVASVKNFIDKSKNYKTFEKQVNDPETIKELKNDETKLKELYDKTYNELVSEMYAEDTFKEKEKVSYRFQELIHFNILMAIILLASVSVVNRYSHQEIPFQYDLKVSQSTQQLELFVNDDVFINRDKIDSVEGDLDIHSLDNRIYFIDGRFQTNNYYNSNK